MTPPFPSPLVFLPRGPVLQAFELRDVYKPPRPSPVARLELVSAHYGHCLIDALKNTVLTFPIRDIFTYFIVSDRALHRKTLSYYTRTFLRRFYTLGLDCRMVELSDFTDFILSPVD
jgi:hypothetical protein